MPLLIQKIIQSFEFASIPPELANDFWLHLLGQCLKDSEVAMQRLGMCRPTSSELLGNLIVNNYVQWSDSPTSEIYKSWYLGQSSAARHQIGQFQGGNNIREHDTAVYLHDIQAAREGFRDCFIAVAAINVACWLARGKGYNLSTDLVSPLSPRHRSHLLPHSALHHWTCPLGLPQHPLVWRIFRSTLQEQWPSETQLSSTEEFSTVQLVEEQFHSIMIN